MCSRVLFKKNKETWISGMGNALPKAPPPAVPRGPFMRLLHLIPELQKRTDQGGLPLRTAESLSWLDEERRSRRPRRANSKRKRAPLGKRRFWRRWRNGKSPGNWRSPRNGPEPT